MTADAAFEARSRRLALVLALASAAIGASVLLGHLLGAPALRLTAPGRPDTLPLTAICFLAVGSALAVRCVESRRVPRALSILGGTLVAAMAAAVLVQYVAGVDLGVDRLLPVAGDPGPRAGRPSPVTALGLLALGLSAATFDVRRAGRGVLPRELFAVTAMFFGFVAAVGDLFGAGMVYAVRSGHVRAVSTTTSAAMFLAAAAALLARPREGLMGVVTSPGPGGQLVRRLGTTAIAVVPILGGLLLVALQAIGVREPPLLFGLAAATSVAIALALVIVTAVPLEKADAARSSANLRIGELVASAPIGIFVADLDGRYTEVNEAACRLLGFAREELIGKTIMDLIHPEEVPRLFEKRARQLAGATDVGDWELRRKDGSFVPVEVAAKILPDGRWQAFVSDVSERVELERKLVESRDFLDRVLESSTEYGIVAEDLEHRIVLWNEGARRAYGHAREEALGRESRMLVADEDAALFRDVRARALALGTAEATLRSRRKDGGTFHTRVVCTRRLDAAGAVAGVLVVARDLSAEQQKLAEQEFLARAGVELAACLEQGEVVERVVSLVLEFVGDGAVVDVVGEGNAGLRTMRHRDPAKSALVARLAAALPPMLALDAGIEDEIASSTASILPETGDALKARLASTDEQRALFDAIGFEAAMVVPLVARGQLLAVVGVAATEPGSGFDEADLRVAQELARRAALALDNAQLFQQSRLQAAMITNLGEGVVLVAERDGRIVYGNPRVESMFRYGPGELIGVPVRAIQRHGELDPCARDGGIVEQLAESGSWQGEIEVVRKDGSTFWCATSVSVFDHADHGPVWIAVFTDIEKRKHLERKNERALREKEVLLKEIHHRVKNNLQVISSLFALQSRRSDTDAARSLLEESRLRVQSIALVHEQLYRSADLAGIDFDEYLRGLVSAIRASYGAHDVAIETSAPDVEVNVEDAVPCALLVCELVSNSLKHAFPSRRGAIRVTMRRERGDRAVLEVEDDGVGLPPGVRLESPASLGLRLVASFARQLRAEVAIDRTRGTRFTLRFALRRGDSVPPPPLEAGRPTPPVSAPR